jgi:GntR family transcriptional repressor for pyruvate dehydrogenase complex
MNSAALSGMEPPTRRTLVESVSEQLLALILGGRISPAERLPSQRELAETLHVGRSTIREALGSLAAIGVVDLRQGRGTFVRQVEPSDVLRPDLLAGVISKETTEQLLEARRIIEPEIANLAAQRATAEDLAAIREVLTKAEAAIEAGHSTYRISPEFHRAVARASHNEVLVMFIESARGHLAERSLLLDQKPGYTGWELESHGRIYEYIAGGQGQEAKGAMARHIDESSAALVEMLR